MPKVDDMVYFKNYQKVLEVSFVIYADFEDINEKVHGCQPIMINHILNHIRSMKTVDMDKKVVCCYDDKYSEPVQIYRGENVVHKFMEEMLEDFEWCKKWNINI